MFPHGFLGLSLQKRYFELFEVMLTFIAKDRRQFLRVGGFA